MWDEGAPKSLFICISHRVCDALHISPWRAALGLLDGTAKVLQREGALIPYGPWFKADVAGQQYDAAFPSLLNEAFTMLALVIFEWTRVA